MCAAVERPCTSRRASWSALNVGDAVSFLSLAPLLENARHLGLEIVWGILHEFSEVVAAAMVEGQAIELGWIHDGVLDVDEADYLRWCS